MSVELNDDLIHSGNAQGNAVVTRSDAAERRKRNTFTIDEAAKTTTQKCRRIDKMTSHDVTTNDRKRLSPVHKKVIC